MSRQTGSGEGPDRRTAVACLASALVAGLVVLLEALTSDFAGPTWPVWWWCSYALFLTALLVATGVLPRPRPVPRGAALAAVVVLAAMTFLLFPVQGWTAILFVVSAAVAASLASRRVVAGVIGVQTVVLAVGIVLGGWPASDVILGVVAYGGFQVFGAMLVLAARREAEARHELAVTHAELRAAVAMLQSASRDAERLRIARDLHDVVGHQLTALALELEVASHAPTTDVHVDRARGIAKGLLADVRTAVGEMRGHQQSWEDSLADLARDLPGLTVEVTVSNPRFIGPEEAPVVLRWAQEAITNTLRHASAERLDLVIDAGPAGIRLSAADDGQGAATVRPGHGLTGMRERFEALGGNLSVQSGPGSGFRLTGRLPASGCGTAVTSS